MRDKVLLQELDHVQPKHPCLVSDDPQIVMTIQQDVHKQKKPWKSHSKVKNSTSKAAAAPLVQNPASPVLPLGCSRQPILHHFLDSIRYNWQISLHLGGPWGLCSHPGTKTGTCGRRSHSINYSQDHQPVPIIPQLSNLQQLSSHSTKTIT